jgi:hypothetical protein
MSILWESNCQTCKLKENKQYLKSSQKEQNWTLQNKTKILMFLGQLNKNSNKREGMMLIKIIRINNLKQV